jgi:hypothetical protein
VQKAPFLQSQKLFAAFWTHLVDILLNRCRYHYSIIFLFYFVVANTWWPFSMMSAADDQKHMLSGISKLELFFVSMNPSVSFEQSLEFGRS